MLDEHLPTGAAGLKMQADFFNDRSDQLNYSWQSFDTGGGRLLSVRIRRLTNTKEAKEAFSSKFRDLQNNHSKDKDDGGADTGSATTLSNAGDAAFSLPIAQRLTRSNSYGVQKYNVHGAYSYCRFKNVVIEVFWEGSLSSDRTSSQGASKVDTFGYAQTSGDARNIVVSVVSALT
ncbi:hypothetical protein GCM10009727_53480 [Actinomadura napierensis]|uniref:Uncharacterized protein n=2 Tax=Actinomadura napierensis TaxID=267854 RepID=A0ABP5LSI1_9ACTN